MNNKFINIINFLNKKIGMVLESNIMIRLNIFDDIYIELNVYE